MPDATRRIGLSLGADICWPICYEGIVRDLDLAIPHRGETVRLEVNRVAIEPYSLERPGRYDLVIDRLTHWFDTSREWIKKGVILDDLYVFNNPWAVQSMEKQTSYCAMMRLGLPIPDTWMIPPKEHAEDSTGDLKPTLEQYASLFDLPSVGEQVGYPLFMKPYDGGGWVGVTKIDGPEELTAAYDESGKFVMHLQKGVVPYETFVRCVGLGPQVRTMRYNPSAPLHERYEELDPQDYLSADDQSELEDITCTINSFFGWDFNSCESLLKDGVWHPIDFANPCPDSQVTSLHVHFPWYDESNIRWSVFCAVTQKKKAINLDWQPFFDIADSDRSYREKLAAYAKIAHERWETDRFHEFCDKHLAHLGEVSWTFFGSDEAKDAVRRKVQALFPEHEWDEFTEHFWAKIQSWRDKQASGSRS